MIGALKYIPYVAVLVLSWMLLIGVLLRVTHLRPANGRAPRKIMYVGLAVGCIATVVSSLTVTTAFDDTPAQLPLAVLVGLFTASFCSLVVSVDVTSRVEERRIKKFLATREALTAISNERRAIQLAHRIGFEPRWTFVPLKGTLATSLYVVRFRIVTTHILAVRREGRPPYRLIAHREYRRDR